MKLFKTEHAKNMYKEQYNWLLEITNKSKCNLNFVIISSKSFRFSQFDAAYIPPSQIDQTEVEM